MVITTRQCKCGLFNSCRLFSRYLTPLWGVVSNRNPSLFLSCPDQGTSGIDYITCWTTTIIESKTRRSGAFSYSVHSGCFTGPPTDAICVTSLELPYHLRVISLSVRLINQSGSQPTLEPPRQLNQLGLSVVDMVQSCAPSPSYGTAAGRCNNLHWSFLSCSASHFLNAFASARVPQLGTSRDSQHPLS